MRPMTSPVQFRNRRLCSEKQCVEILRWMILIAFISCFFAYLYRYSDPISHLSHLSKFRFGQSVSSFENALTKFAPRGEILVTLANMHFYETGILKMWLDQVIACNVTNYIVIAIDDQLYQTLRSHGFNVYLIDRSDEAITQQGTGANHEISSMKYGILSRILRSGWNVLMSDADVLIFQNPFDFVFRDHDIEGSTDAITLEDAYGSIYFVDDPSMGWSRFAQGVRHFNLNSGLFYIRSNRRSIELMDRLRDRLRSEQYWDQQAFNEEIFFLSHGSYSSPRVSVRVMDIYQFMNSKLLFKVVRNDPTRIRDRPVMVHVNYHPDKARRMQAILQLYNNNNRMAFDALPTGSEPGTR